MKLFASFLAGFITVVSGYIAFQVQPSFVLGALGDPFLSLQLAPNPSNGDCLTTDGTDNVWVTCASGGGGGGGGVGWATTTNNSILYQTEGQQLVLSATDKQATNTLDFVNVYGGIAAEYFRATSTSRNSTFSQLFSTLSSSTNATTTTQHISSLLSFGGDTFDELVGDGLDISSGDLIFDCSDVVGTALTCTGEDIGVTANGIGDTQLAFDTGQALTTASSPTFAGLTIGADSIAEYIADTSGAMFTGNTETGITATYQDADNTIDLVVDNLENLAGTLDVGSGGTGATSLSAGQVVVGNGTAAVTTVATGTITNAGNLTFSSSVRSVIGGALSIAIDLASNFAWTGQHDFGAATFLEIPNGTASIANDPGEIAHDTSGDQLIVDDFVMAEGVRRIFSVTVASTSPIFSNDGLLAIPTYLDGFTLTAIRCKVDGGTSKVIAIEDASGNSSEDITCATTVTSDDGSITNATYTAAEESYVDFGATSGTVDTVSITGWGTITRE